MPTTWGFSRSWTRAWRRCAAATTSKFSFSGATTGSSAPGRISTCSSGPRRRRSASLPSSATWCWIGGGAGRTVGGEEALAVGLVNRIHPADKLLPETLEYAKTLARGATLTIGLIKQCVNEGVEQPLASGVALERACGAVAFRSHDLQDGSKAFAEKRAPASRGR